METPYLAILLLLWLSAPFYKGARSQECGDRQPGAGMGTPTLLGDVLSIYIQGDDSHSWTQTNDLTSMLGRDRRFTSPSDRRRD